MGNDTNPVAVESLKTAAMMVGNAKIPRTVDEGESVIPGEIILHMDKIQPDVEDKDSSEVRFVITFTYCLPSESHTMIQFASLNRERREKLSDYYHFRALATELLDKSRRPIQTAGQNSEVNGSPTKKNREWKKQAVQAL
ncbi:hypothetical protein CMV_021270 [Castanea mollissima]|uniref:Uncharacterized protein n=1 Tax=Castanea mollissima TaxID=60419 RepID=A0A8J4QUN1_9ROSI|nr:hypothetical protein CMV_021270 [Castanea mollissima]